MKRTSTLIENITTAAMVRTVLAVLSLSLSLLAQSDSARIVGDVRDSSGQPLDGATVTVSDSQRGATRVLATSTSGEYAVPNLAGIYTIIAEADGCKTVVRSGFEILVGQDIRIDFVLETGEASEKITVTQATPIIDTVNDTLGGTLRNRQINDLPLNGRDFQNLLVLRPGVMRYPGGGIASISANGLRSEFNNFIIDGIDNNDVYFGQSVINGSGVQGTPGTILPIDSIQEFNEQFSPTAEFGWRPGVIVNVGLKSGTNNFHGTGYEFERNAALDARNYFNPAPNPKTLRMHQFGATFGGPIVTGKLFFFTGYEGVRSLVGLSQIFFTPATVSLGGDPANSIPDALSDLEAHGVAESALSQRLATLFATNDGVNPEGIFTNFPNTNRADNGVAKVDYQASDRNVLGVTYVIGDSLQTEQDQPVLDPRWRSQAVTRAQVLGGTWAYMPNPSWVNEVRVGYNRLWQTFLTADASLNPTTAYGINTGVTNPQNFGMPTIRIGNFGPPPPAGVFGGNNGWPQMLRPAQVMQFSDSVSHSRAKNAIKFGGEVRRSSVDHLKNRVAKGRIDFNNGHLFNPDFVPPFPGATPLEDFLAGDPNNSRILVGDTHRQLSFWSYAGFLHDDWRVSSRLTLNVGVRYEMNSVLREAHNLLGNFDPTLGVVQVGQQIPSAYEGDRNDFAPRFGFAWDITGRGRTVLRGGGGMMYVMPNINTFVGQFNFTNDSGTIGLNLVPTAAVGIGPGGTDGTGKINAGVMTGLTNLAWQPNVPVFNVSQVDCRNTPCSVFAADRHLRTPYVTGWNVNLQHGFTETLSLQAAYVGNHGSKIYGVRDINQVDPNSAAEIACGNCEQAGRRFNGTFPGLKNINQLGNIDESNYNALQFTMTERSWRGLSYLLGYTYSHALDVASDNRAPQVTNSFQPWRDYGNSDFDIRHRLTLAFSYALPGRHSPAQILQGWQVNSIVTIQGGQPWNVLDSGNDISLTGEGGDRWNFFGNPADFTSSSTPIGYFADGTLNTECAAHGLASQLQQFGCYAKGGSVMTPPAPGTFGSMGRNIFRGTGLKAWDLSLVKDWKFAERVRLQFRGEFLAAPAPHLMSVTRTR